MDEEKLNKFYNYDINSFRVGDEDLTTTPLQDAFFGTDFVLLKDNDANEVYPPATAIASNLLQLFQNENLVNLEEFGVQLLPITGGKSGTTIQSLSKGTQPYNDFILAITKAKEFADKSGKDISVRSIMINQGEANISTDKTVYKDLLKTLMIDFNTDIKLITGQDFDIEFVIAQTSGWIGRTIGGNVQTDNDIQEAQVEVCDEVSNANLAGAMYQFRYIDEFHPTNRYYVSIQPSVAMKRICYDNSTWNDFKPVSHNVIFDGVNYWTHLKFNIQEKPIRFDVTGRETHNPRGKQTNYGVELLSSGVEKQTGEPKIGKPDTIVLKSSENPAGMTIRYAVNGHAGGGNICDSQNISLKNKGSEFIVDNFAVSFSEYVIN